MDCPDIGVATHSISPGEAIRRCAAGFACVELRRHRRQAGLWLSQRAIASARPRTPSLV
jgi:hypothetical protein